MTDDFLFKNNRTFEFWTKGVLRKTTMFVFILFVVDLYVNTDKKRSTDVKHVFRKNINFATLPTQSWETLKKMRKNGKLFTVEKLDNLSGCNPTWDFPIIIRDLKFSYIFKWNNIHLWLNIRIILINVESTYRCLSFRKRLWNTCDRDICGQHIFLIVCGQTIFLITAV